MDCTCGDGETDPPPDVMGRNLAGGGLIILEDNGDADIGSKMGRMLRVVACFTGLAHDCRTGAFMGTALAHLPAGAGGLMGKS